MHKIQQQALACCLNSCKLTVALQALQAGAYDSRKAVVKSAKLS
jgi:hypothetical protein